MQAARLLNCTCFNSLLYPNNTGCEPHHDSHTKGQKDIWRFIIHCLPGGGLQWWESDTLLCSFDAAGRFFVSSSWAAGVLLYFRCIVFLFYFVQGKGTMREDCSIPVKHGTKETSFYTVSLVFSARLTAGETLGGFVQRFIQQIQDCANAADKTVAAALRKYEFTKAGNTTFQHHGLVAI